MITPTEYLAASKRTDLNGAQNYAFAQRVIESGETVNLLHATIGVCTEAGELLDAMKKHLAYGKEIDAVNIAEECGDVLWYLAIILRELDMSFEEIMQMNINKLTKRFPEKFTEGLALDRDLNAERNQLNIDFGKEL